MVIQCINCSIACELKCKRSINSLSSCVFNYYVLASGKLVKQRKCCLITK